MPKALVLILSHLAVAGAGFALGIYALPILMAPGAPAVQDTATLEQGATYTGEFKRDLADSDFLHWGEGRIFLSQDSITFKGELAPGPDYRLYLSPEFVETEAAFEQLKPQMREVGPVKTFENFVLDVPETVDLGEYSAVIVWCESFGQFITAARYQ